jgi:hypothetical protein
MTSKHLIPADDADDDLSPAMRELRPQERIFVRALFANPGHGAGAKAARAAGYGMKGGATNTPARSANRLFNRPRVIAAIAEMTGQQLRSDGPMAVKTVREIMKDTDHKDRLKAARTVLERADPVEQRFSGTVQHTITDARGSDTEGIRVLLWLQSMGVPRDKQIETLGYSGLPMLEAKLAALNDAERAALKRTAQPYATGIIEGEFTELPRAAASADDDDDEAAEA